MKTKSTLYALLMIVILCILSSANLNKPNDVLEMWVIPHSHCDVGWLKTVQAYFDDEVDSILNTVVKSLSEDPTRRFNWSEIKFF